MTRDQDGIILLNGPELLKLQDGLQVIAKAAGKTVEVKEIDEATFLQNISFIPKVVATSLAATYKEYDADAATLYPKHAEAVANVEKASGRPATKLSAWAEMVKFAFAG